MRPAFTRSLLLMVLASTAALGMAACEDDDDDDGNGGGGDSAQRPSLAIRVTEAGKDKFRMRAPRSVKAGVVRISLTPPPGRTSHDAQLIRVEGNRTVDEVMKAIASEEGAPTPPWLFAAGGVGQTRGGQTASVTQELTPGRYFILDTGEPEGDDVQSYAESGATAELRVTGPRSTAARLPRAPATITADDGAKTYTFTASNLRPGKNTVEFTNDGKELHHVIAFPYNKGATLADVKKAFKEEGEASGPPPLDFEAGTGTAVLEGGTKQVAQLEFKKRGKYALVCFISDRKGGPPHVAKGMIKETTVR